MLVKLLDKDIRVNWELIKTSVSDSLPLHLYDAEGEERVYTELYDKLLDGTAHAWAYYRDEKLVALITTIFRSSAIGDIKELLVFSIWGITEIAKEDWHTGYEQLRRFARVMGCSQVTAYTDVDGIVRQAKKLNAKTRTLILLEV